MNRADFLKTFGIFNAAALLLPGSTRSNSKTEIEYKKVKLGLLHKWTITRGSASFKENVFVKYKRDGITGYGEASHMTAAGQNADRTIKELKKLIPFYKNVDPFSFYDLPQKARNVLSSLSPAKAALDIALMDWIGKKLNIPIHKLFGIVPRRAAFTSFSIGLAKPDIMIKKVREAAPYRILKVKLINRNDIEIIKTIRKATDKPIRVDINEGWRDKEKAIKKIEMLAKMGVEMVEQPMPVGALEETKWLKERSPIPIVADEAINISTDILKLAESYDGISIKLMKSGGIVEAFKMAVTAKAMGMDIMIGCMIESSVAINAAVQLQPLAKWLDLDGNLLISNDPFNGAKFSGGRWIMNENPGIGVIPESQLFQEV
ncbi:MAG: dipeptide epimerase [Acidobacteriota bacterium]